METRTRNGATWQVRQAPDGLWSIYKLVAADTWKYEASCRTEGEAWSLTWHI